MSTDKVAIDVLHFPPFSLDYPWTWIMLKDINASARSHLISRYIEFFTIEQYRSGADTNVFRALDKVPLNALDRSATAHERFFISHDDQDVLPKIYGLLSNP